MKEYIITFRDGSKPRRVYAVGVLTSQGDKYVFYNEAKYEIYVVPIYLVENIVEVK